jgi:hypothetical protein
MRPYLEKTLHTHTHTHTHTKAGGSRLGPEFKPQCRQKKKKERKKKLSPKEYLNAKR